MRYAAEPLLAGRVPDLQSKAQLMFDFEFLCELVFDAVFYLRWDGKNIYNLKYTSAGSLKIKELGIKVFVCVC